MNAAYLSAKNELGSNFKCGNRLPYVLIIFYINTSLQEKSLTLI